MILPNFFVAGAPRCATTALHYYLQKHPQVCMSAIKEPNYFLFGAQGEASIAEGPILRKSVRELRDYGALFRPSADHTAIGEVSPLYLSTREAALRISETCGDVPIVCLVRHPADRAWSHFLHAMPTTTHDEATEQFADLVHAEMLRGRTDAPYRTRTHLLQLGLYGEQVEWYQQVFGIDRVLVLLTEDLESDPASTLERVTDFIGVDHIADLELEHVNESGRSPVGVRGALPAARAVQPAIKAALPPRVAGSLARRRARLTSRVVQSMPPLDSGLRTEITEWCGEDIAKLGRLIDRDLSLWLGPRERVSAA